MVVAGPGGSIPAAGRPVLAAASELLFAQYPGGRMCFFWSITSLCTAWIGPLSLSAQTLLGLQAAIHFLFSSAFATSRGIRCE